MTQEILVTQESLAVATSLGSGSGPRRLAMRRSRLLRSLPISAVALVLACDANPFDATQVPSVTATPNVTLPVAVFSWQPAGAQIIRVYRGSTAGDGYTESLMWSVVATSMNSIASGVEYGRNPIPGATLDVASKLLVPGQVYTVQITRSDPKGSGDGFTNTNNRYVGTATFTLAASMPNSSIASQR